MRTCLRGMRMSMAGTLRTGSDNAAVLRPEPWGRPGRAGGSVDTRCCRLAPGPWIGLVRVEPCGGAGGAVLNLGRTGVRSPSRRSRRSVPNTCRIRIAGRGASSSGANCLHGASNHAPADRRDGRRALGGSSSSPRSARCHPVQAPVRRPGGQRPGVPARTRRPAGPGAGHRPRRARAAGPLDRQPSPARPRGRRDARALPRPRRPPGLAPARSPSRAARCVDRAVRARTALLASATSAWPADRPRRPRPLCMTRLAHDLENL